LLGGGDMIFASVGSMLPFDRFVRAVDEWAAANPARDVFIQIGRGDYEPRHAPWTRIMPIDEYRQRIRDCTLFVAHVGMGSILQGLEEKKQMLLIPRLREQGEHTTDHQLHTAARFRDTPGLRIVDDVPALHAAMTELLDRPMAASAGISPVATPGLIAGISTFLAPARGASQGHI
jgi:UDP-N-acetylglucosamine transferase subunit ALG13